MTEPRQPITVRGHPAMLTTAEQLGPGDVGAAIWTTDSDGAEVSGILEGAERHGTRVEVRLIGGGVMDVLGTKQVAVRRECP